MKRSRTWRAGRYVRVVAYDSVRKNDCPKARQEKKLHSSRAQKEVNLRNSLAKLTTIIAENFIDSPTAIYLTPTFDDDHYPTMARGSQYREFVLREMKNYVNRMQYWAKKRGAILKAVYWPDVGEKGRWHIHMVVDGITLEDALALWPKGDCDHHYLYTDAKWVSDRDWSTKQKNVNPVAIARYAMGSAAARKLGQHWWFHTRSCVVPKPDAAVSIRDEKSIEPPDGCEVLNKEIVETTYSRFVLWEYLLPTAKPKRQRKQRGREPSGLGGSIIFNGKQRK